MCVRMYLNLSSDDSETTVRAEVKAKAELAVARALKAHAKPLDKEQTTRRSKVEENLSPDSWARLIPAAATHGRDDKVTLTSLTKSQSKQHGKNIPTTLEGAFDFQNSHFMLLKISSYGGRYSVQPPVWEAHTAHLSAWDIPVLCLGAR